jgi:hypothetical protein
LPPLTVLVLYLEEMLELSMDLFPPLLIQQGNTERLQNFSSLHSLDSTPLIPEGSLLMAKTDIVLLCLQIMHTQAKM